MWEEMQGQWLMRGRVGKEKKSKLKGKGVMGRIPQKWRREGTTPVDEKK